MVRFNGFVVQVSKIVNNSIWTLSNRTVVDTKFVMYLCYVSLSFVCASGLCPYTYYVKHRFFLHFDPKSSKRFWLFRLDLFWRKSGNELSALLDFTPCQSSNEAHQDSVLLVTPKYWWPWLCNFYLGLCLHLSGVLVII